MGPTKQLRKKLLLRAWLAYLNVVALSCDRAVSRTSCATVLRLSSTSGVRVLANVVASAGRMLTATFFVETVEQTLLVLDCDHLEGSGRHEGSEAIVNLVWELPARVYMPPRCPRRSTRFFGGCQGRRGCETDSSGVHEERVSTSLSIPFSVFTTTSHPYTQWLAQNHPRRRPSRTRCPRCASRTRKRRQTASSS